MRAYLSPAKLLQVLLGVLLTVASPLKAGPVFTGENAVYFERGHYWIELGLARAAGEHEEIDLDRKKFTITDLGSGDSFNPSRVEIVSYGEGRQFAVLSSAKIKGRRCYAVSYGGAAPWESGPVCDPVGREPEKPGGAAGFFREHVAPAFSAYGGEYRWNRLSAGYDLTGSRGSTDIELEPVLGSGRFSLTPFFTYDGTTYKDTDPEKRTDRMRAGADAAARAWTGPVRLSLEGGYGFLRESAGAVEREASSARLTCMVRLDNLLDPLNRHLVSVFKGVDIGAGYAWYDSTESGGGLSSSAPLLVARVTWTVFGSFQLSYGVEAAGADEGSWPVIHMARLRLLLRNALDRPAGRSYHPDLELAFDSGRRMPFYEREERLILGFTFDLYPW